MVNHKKTVVLAFNREWLCPYWFEEEKPKE